METCKLVMRGSSHNPRSGLGRVKKLSLYLRGGLGRVIKKKKKKIHVCCVQFPIANINHILYINQYFHILLGSLIRLQYEGLRSNVTCLMSPNLWRHVTRHESAKQLCIPFLATSASSERTFSSAGRVLESRAPFTLHVGPGKLPENCRSAFCVNANTSRD